MRNVTCKSTNLIYCITCTQCHIQYVGQTKRRLMDRFQGHFYNISKGTEQIGRHFTSPNHRSTKDIEIHILSFIKQHPDSTAGQTARDKVELAWIHRLCTISPQTSQTNCWLTEVKMMNQLLVLRTACVNHQLVCNHNIAHVIMGRVPHKTC